MKKQKINTTHGSQKFNMKTDSEPVNDEMVEELKEENKTYKNWVNKLIEELAEVEDDL